MIHASHSIAGHVYPQKHTRFEQALRGNGARNALSAASGSLLDARTIYRLLEDSQAVTAGTLSLCNHKMKYMHQRHSKTPGKII